MLCFILAFDREFKDCATNEGGSRAQGPKLREVLNNVNKSRTNDKD